MIIEINMITFAGIGAILLLIGNYLIKRFKLLWKYSIPSPVIGGFSFSILALILYVTGIVEFNFDNTLYDLFMFIFFVTIGLTTGLGTLKKGGKLLFYYILVCWGLALLQNGVGIGMALLVGLDPLLGLISGSAALQGGHGMAGSLVPVVEDLGASGALTIGMTAATYGLIAGSLIGGPLGNWLIKKHKLKIETDDDGVNALALAQEDEKKEDDQVTAQSLLVGGTLVFVTLAIGLPTASWLTEVTGYAIPGHIFSLFLGIVFRSFNDKTAMVTISAKSMDIISTVSLNMFLVMAMMKLKLWELYDLALPLASILIVQTILTVAVAAFIMFRVLGKNYDAAIMSAGFMGHGLGATPNGLVVMNAISTKYGVFSRKAFIIIPIAGTVLTDVFGVPLFIFLANLFA